MIKNDSAFKAFCGASAIIVLILALAPLITVPAYTTYASMGQEVNIESTAASNSNEPAVSIIDEEPIFGSNPIYDKYTISERKSLNLPLTLPESNAYYGEKIVYLTFDDGPDSENTSAILRILKENNIKATFFVVGTQVEKYPQTLKNVFDAGHAIGNHSYNHVYRDLYKSPASYIAQLSQTDEKIKNILGVRPRISRAPGGSAGSFTKFYWEELKVNGYTEVGWNISSGDASSAKAPQIVNNIARQLENKFLWSHAIVLMHDGRGHSETVAALPAIIKLFKDRGFEFRVINLETPPAW